MSTATASVSSTMIRELLSFSDEMYAQHATQQALIEKEKTRIEEGPLRVMFEGIRDELLGESSASWLETLEKAASCESGSRVAGCDGRGVDWSGDGDSIARVAASAAAEKTSSPKMIPAVNLLIAQTGFPSSRMTTRNEQRPEDESCSSCRVHSRPEEVRVDEGEMGGVSIACTVLCRPHGGRSEHGSSSASEAGAVGASASAANETVEAASSVQIPFVSSRPTQFTGVTVPLVKYNPAGGSSPSNAIDAVYGGGSPVVGSHRRTFRSHIQSSPVRSGGYNERHSVAKAMQPASMMQLPVEAQVMDGQQSRPNGLITNWSSKPKGRHSKSFAQLASAVALPGNTASRGVDVGGRGRSQHFDRACIPERFSPATKADAEEASALDNWLALFQDVLPLDANLEKPVGVG